MTCEVCGELGHSGHHCPETHEDLNFVNNDNGFHPQNQGWNQRSNTQGNNFNYSQSPSNQGNGYPFLKDLVYSQGRMTDSINKKLHANDKVLENINAKLEDFSSAIKNQLSFNKMLETQLAQLAAAIPSFEKDRIPGKPEATMETTNLVIVSYNGYELDGWDFSTKKGDPRTLVITCSIGPHVFHSAICDLGSSINIMSKEHYEKLFYTELAPTSSYVKLADQSCRYVEGVACDLLVKTMCLLISLF
jgi:hypothetical protein